LRKLQNWNFSSIVAEVKNIIENFGNSIIFTIIKNGVLFYLIKYRSYAGNKVRYVNEQFIELFDMDLITLPHNLPSWFIEQQKLLQQEEGKELKNQ